MSRDNLFAKDSSVGATFSDGQLSYIGQDNASIPQELIDKYSGVTVRIDLSFNCISNLAQLASFKNVVEVVLDSNDIDDDTAFPPLASLQTLSLNKNKIINLYSFLAKVRAAYPSITYLSLLGNAACRHQLSSQDNDDDDYQRYRHYVIYTVPTLKFLDATPITSGEQAEARRVGPLMPVLRPQPGEDEASLALPDDQSSSYTPLPDEASSAAYRHIGLFGKKAYRYNGRHSEGNRFIKNDDL